MSDGNRKWRLLAIAAAVALAVVTGRAQGQQVPQLLGQARVGATLSAAATARADTLQARTVSVDTRALAADVLDIAVTPDVTLRAALDRREALPAGGQAWSGRVPGDPLSAVTLVSAAGAFQGSIRTTTAAYSIEPDGPAYVVRQVDTRLTPPELDPLEPPVGAFAAAAAAADPPMAGDDGGTIDVLVLYTPGARASAGGSAAAVEARIALGVTETNTAYANSGITPRLRLVGTQQVDYTEVGMSADLSAVQSSTSVGALRNAVGADLVSLIVANSTAACGIGYLLNGNAAYGFSVTSYHCISPNYSFGHELGHNMGSTHALEDGSGPGYYPYSYGYKDPSERFRTVMAYDCIEAFCPRVLHFSNPGVSYLGSPTGSAGEANNALSINNTATAVANFRQAVAAGTAPTISAIGNVTIAEDGVTGSLGFTVSDAETPASSLVVSAFSSNTALVPNTAAALALGGSAGSRTLVVRPAANQSGSATISVGVSDGSLTASRTFTLTVTPVNDPPLVARSPAAATVAPGTPAQTTVTVTDVDTAGSALALGMSSADTTLLPNANITMTVAATTANSRTFAVTMTPVAGLTGAATVTLSALDGGTPVATPFSLTVTAVNAPAFAPGVPAVVSTLVSSAATFAVTVNDPDTLGASLTLSGTTTHPSLLAPGGIAVAPISSTATSRTFRVTLTPVAGAFGTGGVTLSASDGQASVNRTVQLAVTSTPGPPDAPTTLDGSATGDTLHLVWTPASTGSAAASYRIAVGTSPAGTTLPVATTTATSLDITVPSSGTYFARVSAVNAFGTSVPSPEAETTVAIAGGRPGRTPRPRAWTSGRTLAMDWDAPIGGDPVTNYSLEVGTAPGLTDLLVLPLGAARSFSTGGVPIGTFWLRVRGANAWGLGDPSEDVGMVMGPAGGCVGLPLAPGALSATTAGPVVSFAWSAPSSGVTPTGYVLYAGAAPGRTDLVSFNTGSTLTGWSGAAPAGLYYVRVAARTACGVGPLSNEVAVPVGAAAPPEAPGTLAAAVSVNVVSLSWSAPASGPVPSSYFLEAGRASGASDIAAFDTGSAAPGIGGAVSPGRYYIRVRARSGAVTGPASNEVVVDVP